MNGVSTRFEPCYSFGGSETTANCAVTENLKEGSVIEWPALGVTHQRIRFQVCVVKEVVIGSGLLGNLIGLPPGISIGCCGNCGNFVSITFFIGGTFGGASCAFAAIMVTAKLSKRIIFFTYNEI